MIMRVGQDETPLFLSSYYKGGHTLTGNPWGSNCAVEILWQYINSPQRGYTFDKLRIGHSC